ncbi:MAG: CinA family protein [Sulfurospirillum sp.]|nr:CinA family protein [Sulfurospirillum sp.]
MQTSLIILGNSLRPNTIFLQYIDSHVNQAIGEYEQCVFLDKSDKDIFLRLENILKSSQMTYIVASKDSFNLANKIIATLSEDSLVLKNDTLIPSKAQNFSKNSYLLESENFSVSVILAEETYGLPSLHVKQKEQNRVFSLIDLDEDAVKIFLEPLAATYEIKLATSTLIEGWVLVQAQTLKYGDRENFLKATKSLFPNKFIQEQNIAKFIVNTLSTYGKKIATAESCTGGSIASLITSVSGSSAVFDGGIVSYANEIKHAWLGVNEETLHHFGAVSEECLSQMLEGILDASKADFAVATSGIAGPNGGSESKPVGTVFVGAKGKNGAVLIERLLLRGDRAYIQKQSCYHALKLLLRVAEDLFFAK